MSAGAGAGAGAGGAAGVGRARVADLRIALPATATWVLAALLVGAPGAAVVVVVVAAAVLVAGVVALAVLREHRTRVVAAVLVVIAGLGVVVGVATWTGSAARTPQAVRALAGTGDVTVSVRLDRDLHQGDRSVTGTLVTVDPGEGPVAVAAPVRVVPALGDAGGRSVGDDAFDTRPVIAAGSVLSAPGRIEADPPGSVVAFVVFLRAPPTVETGPSGLLGATDAARTAFADVTTGLPAPGAALLRGLAIGDRSGLDDATQAAMEASSLTHLTAVSGSNCAVLVALVVMLGRAAGLSRVVRAGLAIVVLLGFVLLVRPDPSIVRATVMAVVVLVVHLSGRPVRGVPLVAVAALGMLVADPWVSRSFAFALSVLATAGILVLGPPLVELLARRLWTPVAVALAVPVAAQVACWPVTIPLQAALPVYAVPANLLAEPLAPIATVVGLAACLLAPLWPAGAGVLAAIAWVPAAGIGAVAHGAAAMPFAAAPWPAGVVGVVVAAVACLLVAAGVLIRPGHPHRHMVLLAAGVTTVVGVVAVGVPAVVLRVGVPSGWAIAACDVGQGDAVLLRDAGQVALVDTGDEPELLEACLGLLGVDRIDLLVLTHFDRDHVGAVDVVHGRTARALVGPVGRPEDARVVDGLVSSGTDVTRVDDGVSGRLGALDWRVLWPRAGSSTAGNDASVVLATTPGTGCSGCLSAVFLGDLGATAQRRLRPVLRESASVGTVGEHLTAAGEHLVDGGTVAVPVDVVKVAHHGSADQDPGTYELLGARVGLVGVGDGNTYGHPAASALAMLWASGTTAVRTDLRGTVAVTRSDDGATLDVWTERGGSAAGRRLVDVPSEGTHARQEARTGRREDRPGPVVRHPPRSGRPRHRSGDVPGGARDRDAPRPARRRGPCARGARPRSRPVLARSAGDARESVALRRTPARPRGERREVH